VRLRRRRSRINISAPEASDLSRGRHMTENPSDPSPARIVRVITRLNIGGPSQHVIILTEALNDERFHSRLICGSVDPGEGDMTPEALARGLAITQLPALRNHGGIIDAVRTVWALYREFRVSRPQIVHLHQFKARLLGAIAARVAGVPHIVQTHHGTLFQRYFAPPRAAAVAVLERCLGRWLVHRTIAVSDAVRQELLDRRIVAPPHVAVIPLGLTLAPFLEAPRHAGALREELGIPPDAMVIGFIGRLVPIKAAHHFLEAAAEVMRTAHRPVYAVVVGDGPQRRSLEKWVREMAIADRIFFLGWRRDLARVYGDIDVLALSSLNEGTPVVIIEAMAARRAIVATRVGGVPDVIKDGRTGLLVEPNSPQRLAAALRRVIEHDDLRQQFAAAAQAWVYPRYDAATLCAAMKEYYLDILRERAKLQRQIHPPREGHA
jgi:glycosyltransferase involved in cell wall biosynthesis